MKAWLLPGGVGIDETGVRQWQVLSFGVDEAAAIVGEVGLAIETDSALAPGIGMPPGLAQETETALAPGIGGAPGLAAENDNALAPGVAQAPGLAIEVDEALRLRGPTHLPPSMVTRASARRATAAGAMRATRAAAKFRG